MDRDIDLMVLPPRALENRPRFLYAADGMWRDLGTAAGQDDLSTVQTRIDTQLHDDMDALASTGGGIVTSNYFSLIYDALIPEPVQRLLSATNPANAGDPPPHLRIHIDPSLDWIPWEVAFDGNEFLGLRFRISRLPIVRVALSEQAPADPRQVQQIYNFLGEFVLDAAMLSGWEKTFPLSGAPAGVVENRFPAAGNGQFPRVRDVELAAPRASIMHVTCHGGLKDAGAKGGGFWTLNHRQPTNPLFKIHANVVEGFKPQFVRTQPLVFGNACASSSEAIASGGLVTTFGALFMQAGASGFIGTVAPIAKTAALDFAQRFYNHLLARGEPIGTALWRAKQDSMQQAVNGDPSALFYCHYGLPQCRYAF